MHWIEQLRQIARDGGEGWHLIAADLCEDNGADLIAHELRSKSTEPLFLSWPVVIQGLYGWFSPPNEACREWNRVVREYKGEPKAGDVVSGPFGVPHKIGSWESWDQ